MTVRIDAPAWPAHGTMWSHMISDASLGELHDVAKALGLPRRGFDLDHYDVPAARHADALDAGAVPTGGRELARRLAACGLRVPGRDRPPLRRLREQWGQLAPGVWEIGDELLVRWREPHRVYHGPRHLGETLAAVRLLAAEADASAHQRRLAEYAAWFHDAVHEGAAGTDEDASAQLATDLLAGVLEGPEPAEVARLVRLTAKHDPAPGDVAGSLLSDADLAILGSSPVRYTEYAAQVRSEYAHVSDDAFRVGRMAVLDQLLGRRALYRTRAASLRWQANAFANLRAEYRQLETGKD